MNTHAFLGYACVGYPSSEVAFTSCDVDGRVLVRLVGQAPEGHTGNKTDFAQKGKAGYLPCCATATHVALPPTFLLGARDALKATGIHLRKGRGP